MRKETFKDWVRVSKAKARKAFEKGQNILIAPVNANMSSPWGLYAEVNKAEGDWDSFEQMDNSFWYYNCGYRELGLYPKYFVKEV